MLYLLLWLIPNVLAVGMPGVSVDQPPLPPVASEGESEFAPGRSGFATGGAPPPEPSFEPAVPQENFGQQGMAPQPGLNTRFLPSQDRPPINEPQDFGGGSPFDENRPAPDYEQLGDYDMGVAAGPAGPLSPYLTPLRRFFNPMTRHHFVHSDAGVMMRNIGAIGKQTHHIISVPRYNRNRQMIDQLCPYLVRLNSMRMGGAQLLVSNPRQHRRGKMMGWTDTAPAGMCSRVPGACGATLPLVAARRTNLEPDFIHFVTRVEMNQYLMTHRNFVPSGRGVICWVWP